MNKAKTRSVKSAKPTSAISRASAPEQQEEEVRTEDNESVATNTRTMFEGRVAGAQRQQAGQNLAQQVGNRQMMRALGVQRRRAAAPSTDSATSTGSGTSGRSGGSKKSNHEIYPDPSITPGDALPGVTEKQVSVPGYTKTVRNVSDAEKQQVFENYNIPYQPGQMGKDYEVDHFISLELGGSNDIKNLWPQPYNPTSDPSHGARVKDHVENKLHADIVSGDKTLKQAQQAITSDWVAQL